MTPSQRQNPMSCNGMVTSPHYLASQAGLDILRRGGTAIDGAELAHSAAEAYEMSGADAMVLGGQSVFRDMMPYIDRVFVTKINCRPRSDSFFENLDESSDWCITDQSEALREGDIEYSFICYERIER